MKRKQGIKLLSFFLAVVMLSGIIPARAFAAEKWFCLVAEAGGRLIIAPEYIRYSDGQTVGEALAASGHDFTGLESGMVSAIDGVAGNYTRSDQDGSFDLNTPASRVSHYRFSEDSTTSQPSEGMMLLMTAMADYLLEDLDVRTAAKTAYDAACGSFVGAQSAEAKRLAEDLNMAVSAYQASQEGAGYSVSFTDGTQAYTSGNYPGILISAVNTYGKIWNDRDGDGVLELPAGSYTFQISQNGLWIDGSITVAKEMTVSAAFPAGQWLKTAGFRLSGSYGKEGTGDSQSHFSDDEFQLGQWNDRRLTVPVSDTFTGTVYTCAQYDGTLLSSVPALTAIYTSAETGEEVRETLSFDSVMVGPTKVLKSGSRGNTVIYRISAEGTGGYTYSQDYTVVFERVPTLTSLRVADQEGTDQAATSDFDGNVTNYTYKVLDSVTSVTVKPVPLEDGYQVSVNGQNAVNGVKVNLNTGTNGTPVETVIPVRVSAGGYENTYTLTICPGAGKKILFQTTSADVQVQVVNSNGLVMPYKRFLSVNGCNNYQYTLVPGETYRYVATRDTCYHTMDAFTLEELANSTVTVEVPVENWLTELSFGPASDSGSKGRIKLDTSFSSGKHNYLAAMEDTESNIYVWVNGVSGVTVQAVYTQLHGSSLYHGKEKTVALTGGKSTGTQLQRVLLMENPYGNTVTIRLARQVGGITQYQDYTVEFVRQLSLKDMTAACNGATVPLTRENGAIGYSPAVREYTVTVPLAAENLQLTLKKYEREVAGSGWNTCYGDDSTGYQISVDGTDVTEAETAVIALDGTIHTQTAVVTVTNSRVPERSTDYVIRILKSPPVKTVFNTAPGGALISLYEVVSGNRVWPGEDGTYLLAEGFSYSYTLTKYGYIGQSGSIDVTRDESGALVLRMGEKTYQIEQVQNGGGSVRVSLSLKKAAVNTAIDPSITAQWGNFRGNAANNAVTDAKTPVSAEEGTLYWANQLGNGFDEDAVGSPIIVDGCLITYAGDTIYRVDTVSGEILATGKMDHKSSFAITPPAYYEGMIFVALSNGTVQAFNAETLESLWVYQDALGGQPNSPLTVKNGYLYTGFWNSETADANFVCLPVTDEDPSKTGEAKCAAWYFTRRGGFYWAGAYVSDDFLLVGTDDGCAGYTSQTSQLLLLDPKTGAVLDSWDGLNADIRSTVVYDGQTNAYYFTSKGGSFYSVQVTKDGNKWKLSNKWSVKLSNGSGSGVPMSTCSPVVYRGRAYIGVSGVGQFTAYSGHNITVIDLGKKSIAYRVATQGYPQTSGLLTTAYEAESGYAYIFFFDNQTPGKLRVLRDKAGQTKGDYVTVEGSFTTAYALFTPTGDQAQYAICSPIVDTYGTIYFKNDSANLMAFGSAVRKIEVTKLPDKTTYLEGETFDPAGMVVTATYANGMTRDITEYVTYSRESLTANDSDFAISFGYVMYHNQENGTAMTSGVLSTTPQTSLPLTVKTGTLGDVNGDGKIDRSDAQKILDFEAQASKTGLPLVIADVSGDGRIDSNDAVLILQYKKGLLNVFPADSR